MFQVLTEFLTYFTLHCIVFFKLFKFMGWRKTRCNSAIFCYL